MILRKCVFSMLRETIERKQTVRWQPLKDCIILSMGNLINYLSITL